jgi:hypothetical protein
MFLDPRFVVIICFPSGQKSILPSGDARQRPSPASTMCSVSVFKISPYRCSVLESSWLRPTVSPRSDSGKGNHVRGIVENSSDSRSRCILLFPVLGEAVRIFLCQGLAQILLAVRSKVVTTWIVWSGPRRPSCTSPRRRAKPRFSGGSPRIALLWAIWGNRCTVCKSCKAA